MKNKIDKIAKSLLAGHLCSNCLFQQMRGATTLTSCTKSPSSWTATSDLWDDVIPEEKTCEQWVEHNFENMKKLIETVEIKVASTGLPVIIGQQKYE